MDGASDIVNRLLVHPASEAGRPFGVSFSVRERVRVLSVNAADAGPKPGWKTQRVNPQRTMDMTVAELMRALSRCRMDQMVYVTGDETGDFPVVGVSDVRLRFSQDLMAVCLEVGDCDYDGNE